MTDPAAATAFAGGESAFAALTERHRRELHVHCYRMLASFDEADDAVQETFLRAWRARDTFDGSALVRAWLYKIATNTFLSNQRKAGREGPLLEGAAATVVVERDDPDVAPALAVAVVDGDADDRRGVLEGHDLARHAERLVGAVPCRLPEPPERVDTVERLGPR